MRITTGGFGGGIRQRLGRGGRFDRGADLRSRLGADYYEDDEFEEPAGNRRMKNFVIEADVSTPPRQPITLSSGRSRVFQSARPVTSRLGQRFMDDDDDFEVDDVPSSSNVFQRTDLSGLKRAVSHELGFNSSAGVKFEKPSRGRHLAPVRLKRGSKGTSLHTKRNLEKATQLFLNAVEDSITPRRVGTSSPGGRIGGIRRGALSSPLGAPRSTFRRTPTGVVRQPTLVTAGTVTGVKARIGTAKRSAGVFSRAGIEQDLPMDVDDDEPRQSSPPPVRGARAPRQIPRGPAAEATPDLKLCRVKVTNLNKEITKEDLREVFGMAGKLRAVAMGPGVGEADLLFFAPKDAARSVQLFNGREFEGKKMHVSLLQDVQKSRVEITAGGAIKLRKKPSTAAAEESDEQLIPDRNLITSVMFGGKNGAPRGGSPVTFTVKV